MANTPEILTPKLELIANYECNTGEGPLWHPDEKRLYWVDIPAGRLFRFDHATGKHEIAYEGRPIGGFTIQTDGSLVLFQDRGSINIWREGEEELETVFEGLPGEADNRFNDVIADPQGRVFCGTMSSPTVSGRLYRLDPDGAIRVVQENVGVSNGLGFTPDRKKMYYTDSTAHQIYIYDYDESTGEISNREVFVDSSDEDGVPDGMTVDADGFVWSARWNGNRLSRYSPDGHEVMRLLFPTKKVSCPTFGGPDYSELFVTTAGGQDKTENGQEAGALFRIRLDGIRGVPEFRSRIGLD